MTNNQIFSALAPIAMAMAQASAPSAEEMLTVKEVCILLKVSRWTVRRMCKRGLIRYIKLSSSKSGAVRIFRESVEEYLSKLDTENVECAQQS